MAQGLLLSLIQLSTSLRLGNHRLPNDRGCQDGFQERRGPAGAILPRSPSARRARGRSMARVSARGPAVEGAVDLVQMRYKPLRDVCVLNMCIFFLLLNTCCDVGMTVVLAQGINLDDAFSEPVGPHAGYSRVLARELLALIMPGYLIVPYLVEPIFTICLPKYLGVIVARADERVKEPLATAWVHCIPMELSWRYADIVNNLSLCWLLLFLSSPRGWEACMYYIGFLMLISVIDRCTLLRIARSWHTSRELHRAFCFLLMLPTGILGLAAVFWLRQASHQLHEIDKCHVFIMAGFFHLL